MEIFRTIQKKYIKRDLYRLRDEKNINTNIINNIQKAYADHMTKNWAEERLSALGRNKYISKGLYLYFPQTFPTYNYPMWSRFPINSKKDFEHWKKIVLEGKPLSIEMEDKLRPRVNYSPESYPQQQRLRDTTCRNWPNNDPYLSAREILIIIAILLSLIVLLIR